MPKIVAGTCSHVRGELQLISTNPSMFHRAIEVLAKRMTSMARIIHLKMLYAKGVAMRLTERRKYDALRSIIELRGGTMSHIRRGRPQGGTWVVRLGQLTAEFDCVTGGFPKMDNLYVPKRDHPTDWRHYSCEPVKDVENKWISLITVESSRRKTY